MTFSQMLLERELSEKLQPCNEAPNCLNSPKNTNLPKCAICKLSPVFNGTCGDTPGVGSHWRPHVKGLKHPVLEQWKREASIQRREMLALARKNKDHRRQAVLHAAELCEKLTEKVITSTVNSGRKLRDGDHVSFGVTLDTKQQSQRLVPVVHWHELDKVRRDAKRSGKAVGGLVIHANNGRAVVVFALEDYATLMKQGQK